MDKTINFNIFENWFAISNNDVQLKAQQMWFKNANLPIPTKFKATGICEQSHYDLVQYAIRNNLQHIVMFEDDAYPCEGIVSKLTELQEILISRGLLSGLIQMGYTYNGWCGKYNNKTIFNNFFINEYTFGGAHAILLFADSFKDRVNSLLYPSRCLNYNYMEMERKRFNYANRFAQDRFQHYILLYQKLLFCQKNIIKNRVDSPDSKFLFAYG